ncbi:hypothetical protein ACFL5Z_08675 [Planctomycetota bacterium]
MKTRSKRLLIVGVLLVSLTSVVLWLFGVRIEHVRFLVMSLSEPPKLSTEETAYARQIPSEQEMQDQKDWKLALQHARVLLQHLKFYGVLTSLSKATDLMFLHFRS